MGTRKSRHNKARKPLYKEHRVNLVTDEPERHAPFIQEPALAENRNFTVANKTLIEELKKILAARAEQEKLPVSDVPLPMSATEWMERKRLERARKRGDDPNYRGSKFDLMWDGGNPFNVVYLKQLI